MLFTMGAMYNKRKTKILFEKQNGGIMTEAVIGLALIALGAVAVGIAYALKIAREDAYLDARIRAAEAVLERKARMRAEQRIHMQYAEYVSGTQ